MTKLILEYLDTLLHQYSHVAVEYEGVIDKLEALHDLDTKIDTIISIKNWIEELKE